MPSILTRVVHRYAAATRVVVDLQATLQARNKYPLFSDLIIGKFDSTTTMYRVFDEIELGHILASGRITGGNYSVKAERDHGASWGSNINEVIPWGLRQLGGRLGQELYLAKLDAFDVSFMHLDPGVAIDPNGAPEQTIVFDTSRCNTGLGCSLINVKLEDVDIFKVNSQGQIQRQSIAELKAGLKTKEETPKKAPTEGAPVINDKLRDPTWELQPKAKVIVTKGSTLLGIGVRDTAQVVDVWQRVVGGKPEKEIMVRLQFVYPRKTPDKWTREPITLYATHANRLKDHEIALLDSRGSRILIKKR